jgi:hypothetical protein
VRNGNPDLANLPVRQGVICVVPGLGGQIECDAEAGLSLGEVGPVELVGRSGACRSPPYAGPFLRASPERGEAYLVFLLCLRPGPS